MKPPTKKQKTAITAVLDKLKKYKGEEIVAHEHPLHRAVVRLEELCRKRPGRHPDLFYPARLFWYHLLWASRGTGRGVMMDTKEKTASLTKTLKLWLKKIPQDDPPRLSKKKRLELFNNFDKGLPEPK